MVGLRSLLLAFPRHWLCKRAAANIGVTNHVKDRVKLPRSQTIYHGIETCAAPVQTASQDSGVATRRVPLQVAFVGRFVAEKGLPVLLRAAQKLQESGVDFFLHLIGDGPERPALEARARELRIERSVNFTGTLQGKDLEAALRGVSTLVMPSIWEETAGLSAIEHMMRGGVVIAADIGGLSEVVGDTGLKFPPGDSQALADCIRKLSQEPSLVASLGAAAQARAKKLFRIGSMIDAHLALYQEALA